MVDLALKHHFKNKLCFNARKKWFMQGWTIKRALDTIILSHHFFLNVKSFSISILGPLKTIDKHFWVVLVIFLIQGSSITIWGPLKTIDQHFPAAQCNDGFPTCFVQEVTSYDFSTSCDLFGGKMSAMLVAPSAVSQISLKTVSIDGSSRQKMMEHANHNA